MLIARHRPVITWTDRSRCLLRHRRNRSGRSALTITLLLRDLLLQNKLRDREHMDCIGLTNCTEYIANCGWDGHEVSLPSAKSDSSLSRSKNNFTETNIFMARPYRLHLYTAPLSARSQACEEGLLALLWLSVRLFVRMEQLGSHWSDFIENWRLSICRNSVDKIDVS